MHRSLLPPHIHLLVAVSGGIDSVVLTDLLAVSGFSFSIAHCNFQLRGEESTRDEMFVRSLAEQYQVPVFVKHFDTRSYAAANQLGIQEAARELRYEWFSELLQAAGHQQPSYLVTAHHADDNVETVLFNIFRGTGISGLHGILPRQGKTLRPLLFASREDILHYARERQLQWVEDSSNESTRYTRNYIRHEVLPMLKQIFPAVAENVNSSIERWREAEELYQQALQSQLTKLCVYKGNECHMPVRKLQKTKPLLTVLFEIVRPYGFTSAQVPDILSLLHSATGKYVASTSHRVIRNRDWLIIVPLQTQAASYVLINEGDQQISFADGTLQMEMTKKTTPSAIPSEATLDAAEIQFPLLLRRWKQGDYFYPLGMQKKKKLSRFFIDQKLSLSEKENAWILESKGRIIWVVGYRIDNRFRIKNGTGEVLRISLRTSN